MKHTNQEQKTKNQVSADQNKKNSKTQQGVRSEAGDTGSHQTVKGNREHQSEQESEGSNGQKGKQLNRK